MFFVGVEKERSRSQKLERLSIFGERRGRRGAQLKVPPHLKDREGAQALRAGPDRLGRLSRREDGDAEVEHRVCRAWALVFLNFLRTSQMGVQRGWPVSGQMGNFCTLFSPRFLVSCPAVVGSSPKMG